MNRSTTPTTRTPRPSQTQDPRESATSAPDPHEQGLPAWMTAPQTIFYAILIIMLIFYELYAGYVRRAMWVEAKPNDACMTITSVAQTGDGEQWATRQQRGLKAFGLDTLNWVLVPNCLAETCTVTHLKNTADRIDGYLNTRVRYLNASHRAMGAEGVALVKEAFTDFQHHEILNHTRQLIAAKKIDIGSFSRLGQATYKLLAKHGNDNVPICYKPSKA
jgi:hypothetical protein